MQGGNLIIAIPATVLQEAADQASPGQRADSVIRLNVTTVEAACADRLRSVAERQAGAKLTSAGDMLEFQLTLTTMEGQTFILSRFKEPIKLSFAVDLAGDEELAGLYYLADNGTIEYVPTVLKAGMLEADIHHFSKYAVLEYDKDYVDVKPEHWAFRTVKLLSARHLVDGIDSGRFGPDQTVTRAEFVTMLVRLLGLSGSAVKGTYPFVDVALEQWYSEEVLLAAQAGIVEGAGDSRFAPEAHIQRQEMAAMLMRAHAYATGALQANGTASASRFKDMADAPDWAKQAVDSAAFLGLLSGRSDSLFVPEGEGTRAESAQILLNLYKYLQARAE